MAAGRLAFAAQDAMRIRRYVVVRTAELGAAGALVAGTSPVG
jgi:hypothetical protein